jgi:hypothetical protein
VTRSTRYKSLLQIFVASQFFQILVGLPHISYLTHFESSRFIAEGTLMPRDYGRYLETKAGPETTAQHQRNKFSNMNSSPMKTNPKTRTFNPYASERFLSHRILKILISWSLRDYSFGYAGNTEEYNKALALRYQEFSF